MNNWLRNYVSIWEAYHRERLKREAQDRWLFFALGLIVGLALGAAIAGVMLR